MKARLTPVYINCRDRVTELRELVAWLERIGQERIILLDNDSTWEPLLEFYDQTPHGVCRLGRNCGSKALWEAGIVPDERFIYTDPDLIPLPECPADAVQRLVDVLDRYDADKVGLGLYLEDVPEEGNPLAWERQLVAHELEPGIFGSQIDTTFALYEPGRPHGTANAIRLGHPYQMRHMSWYKTELTDEDRHYLARAADGHWGSAKQYGPARERFEPPPGGFRL